MPLSKDRINNIWWAGFCAETVRQAAATDLVKGGQARMEWLSEHTKTCFDCASANHLKNLEDRAARRIGPAASAAFMAGKGFTELPGADKAIESVMNEAVNSGEINGLFIAWMAIRVKRNGKDFDEYEG